MKALILLLKVTAAVVAFSGVAYLLGEAMDASFEADMEQVKPAIRLLKDRMNRDAVEAAFQATKSSMGAFFAFLLVSGTFLPFLGLSLGSFSGKSFALQGEIEVSESEALEWELAEWEARRLAAHAAVEAAKVAEMDAFKAYLAGISASYFAKEAAADFAEGLMVAARVDTMEQAELARAERLLVDGATWLGLGLDAEIKRSFDKPRVMVLGGHCWLGLGSLEAKS